MVIVGALLYFGLPTYLFLALPAFLLGVWIARRVAR
jgi:hypothetical protein